MAITEGYFPNKLAPTQVYLTCFLRGSMMAITGGYFPSKSAPYQVYEGHPISSDNGLIKRNLFL